MFFLPQLLIGVGLLFAFSVGIYKAIRRLFSIRTSAAIAALKLFFVFLWLFSFVLLFFQSELFGRTSADSYQILLLASVAMASVVGIFSYWILKILLADN